MDLGNESIIEGRKDAIRESVSGFTKSGVGNAGRRVKNVKQVVKFALISAFVLVEKVADDVGKWEFAVAGKSSIGQTVCANEARFVQTVKEGR